MIEALVQELRSLQSRKGTVSQQLRGRGTQVDELNQELNKVHKNLYYSYAEILQAWKEAQEYRLSLKSEREQCRIAKRSLEYEFSMHELTEILLDRERQMNRDMILSLNQIELPLLVKNQRLRLSDVFGLGCVIKANYIMKETLKQQSAQLT